MGLTGMVTKWSGGGNVRVLTSGSPAALPFGGKPPPGQLGTAQIFSVEGRVGRGCPLCGESFASHTSVYSHLVFVTLSTVRNIRI